MSLPNALSHPIWLDTTPLTRAFVGSFAGLPARLVSQAHEFREARNDFDEEMRLQREIRKAQVADRFAAGARKLADKRLAAVIADLLPGETFSAREKRKKREHYAAYKDYYANRYQAQKAARLAALA